jgi:tetratricopeptide (TPR) repeat protein
MTSWDDHPDAEQLASYIERSLDPGQRSEVEAHLAECEDCRRVVVDSADLLAEEHPPSRKQGSYALAGLATAAVLVFAVWTMQDLRRPDIATPQLDGLVTAFANARLRPVEGRLSIPFSWAPAPAVTRGTTEVGLPPDVRIAVAEAERGVRDDGSAAAHWTLGLARLAGRDFDGAIEALERGVEADGSSSRLSSDLAAAYLARLKAGGPPEDAARALAAADRALDIDARLPEALFNRALAIEVLEPDEAASAWRAVVAQDGASAWGKEAAARQLPQ